MKASDLAALAALGLGGAYLYNRNKGDAAPKGAETVRGEAADFVNRGAAPAAPAAAKEDITPAEMPAYQGRSADRREDIQSEYGQDYQTPYNAPKAVAPVVKKTVVAPAAPAAADARAGARGAQGYGDAESTSIAAKAALAQGDAAKVDSLGTTKTYMDDQRAKTAARSTAAKATLAKGDAAKVNSLGATKAYMDNQRAKKAAATANSQAIIDRMANRKRPYLKDEVGNDLKRGGAVKKMASGGAVKSSASSRGDGIAQRGKTRGKMY